MPRLGLSRLPRRITAFIAFVGLLISSNLSANTGTEWITSQAQPNGSYRGAHAIAQDHQATAEALRTFEVLGLGTQIGQASAQVFVTNQAFSNTETLARQIIAKADANGSTATLVAQLLSYQSAEDGGFGEFPGYNSTVLDTAYALEALAIAGKLGTPELAFAVGYIQQHQNANGGWAVQRNLPDAVYTSTIVRAVALYRAHYNVESSLAAAAHYLLGLQAPDLTWPSTLENASAVLALGPWMSNPSLLNGALTALKHAQATDGSWGQDVFLSALALRAIWVGEQRNSGTAASLGALRGRVVDVVSGGPIAGATIQLSGNTSLSLLSAADGGFMLPSIAPGTYTLTVTKSGFGGVSGVFDVAGGIVKDVGDVGLTLNNDSSLVQITVVDAISLQPVADVAVRFDTTTHYEGSTSASGALDFGLVIPGTYTYQLLHPSYQSQAGSLAVQAGIGNRLRFALLPKSAETDSVPVTVSGRLVSSIDGAVIADATVLLNGLLTAVTDAQGRFTFVQAGIGEQLLEISADRYANAQIKVVLPNGASGELGDLSLSPTSTPLPDDVSAFRLTLFDAETNALISGAVVSLTGNTDSYSATTDGDGKVSLDVIAPGTYTLNIAHAAYLPYVGYATLPGSQQTAAHHGLVALDNQLAPTSLTISGTVIDGETGQVVPAASVFVNDIALAATDSNGHFAIPDQTSGTYRVQVRANGYSDTHFNVNFPWGANGDVGDLPVFAATQAQTPTHLTLNGLVVDSVTGQMLPDVTVRLVETAQQAVSGLSGQFVLSDIALQTFQLDLSADGYLSQTATVNVEAFGSVSAKFTLQPAIADPGVDSSDLRGSVVDSDTGEPLTGVTVQLSALGLQAATDASGTFTFEGIGLLEFEAQASLPGYHSRTYALSLPHHGSFTLPIKLVAINGTGTDPATSAVIQVLNAAAAPSAVAFGDALRVHATVANLSANAYEILAVGEVLSAEGESIANLSAVVEGTDQLASPITIAPGDTADIELLWPAARALPGNYQIAVSATEPGSRSAALPSGVVYGVDYTQLEVLAARAISGHALVFPPLLQAGTGQPLNFSAVVANAGNVDLRDLTLRLRITDEADEQEVYVVEAGLANLAVQQQASVAFAPWIPDRTGNFVVTITPQGDVDGAITASTYVGDKPTASFTLDRTLTPEGTHTIRAALDLQGVDVTQGSVSDPLFAAVKQAVTDGGEYVAPEGVAWNERNRCQGCHTQSQSLYGLASSFNKAPIDLAAAKYLYNSMSSALQDNGLLSDNQSHYGRIQTALSAWALASWPDHRRNYRTLYHGARYLDDRRVVSGNQTYWTPEHRSGWWYSDEAMTALVAQTLVDVVERDAQLAIDETTDYGHIRVGFSNIVDSVDMEIGPDGWIYVLTINGAIWRVSPDTGEAAIWVTGTGNQANGLAFDDAGRAYVSTLEGRITRINTDKSVNELIATNTRLRDIEFGPDGLLYVLHDTNSRIYRFDPASPTLEAWLSGGLLSSPRGLAFTPTGKLLVANVVSRNVLSIDINTEEISIFADGLAYQPIRLDIDEQGYIYYSSYERNSDLYSPKAINRISPEGLTERIGPAPGIHGVLVANGDVYYHGTVSGELHRMTYPDLNRDRVSDYRSRLPGIAHYLVDRSGGSDLIVRASILTGLAEVLPFVTDPVLRARVEDVIAQQTSVLRQYQRPDGGWGRYFGRSSDPMVTALVGLALEYTDPSPDDPTVRGAILYLLNSQQVDGSWTSTNRILSTRLAATSLVMAYLPEALERLGGLDIDLRLTLPSDITLSNPSLISDSTALAGGAVEHYWRLLGVTSEGRGVSFDATFHNMLLNEQRPAAIQAVAQFENSFTGALLELPIDIPVVTAVSGLHLGVAVDKAVYGAEEDVDVASTVSNLSAFAADGMLHLGIYAAGSQTPYHEFEPTSVVNLAANGSQAYGEAWNTGIALAGDYELRGAVLNDQGQVLAADATAFEIAAPLSVLAGDLSTDKQIYDVWDSVDIAARVRNAAANVVSDPAVATVEMMGPDGTLVTRYEFDVGALVPGGQYPSRTPYILDNASIGEYQLNLYVRDPLTRQLKASASTAFQVQQQTPTLAGLVEMSPQWLYVGEMATCRSTLRNRSDRALTQQAIRHRVMNVTTSAVLFSEESVVDIDAGGMSDWVVGLDTTGWPIDGYACVLDVWYDGAWYQAGIDGFGVLEPPIRINGALTQGAGGRLLVLTDPPELSPDSCTPVTSLALGANLETPLATDSELIASLYDANAQLLDQEQVSLRTYVAPQDAQLGADGINLAVNAYSAQSLQIGVSGLARPSGHLGEDYRLAVSLTDGSNVLAWDTSIIHTECAEARVVGETFGGLRIDAIAGLLDAANDQHGPSSSPSESSQYHTLETLLKSTGYEYTLVTNADAFEQAFYTGGYAAYALLSEQVKLSDDLQKAVREAAYRGEGLLIAGDHDQRNSKLYAALGVEYRGKYPSSVGVEFSDSELGLAQSLDLLMSDKTVKITLGDALSAGRFVAEDGSLSGDAVVYRTYGAGQTVHVGYDFLAEATLAGLDSLHADLLLDAIDQVMPDTVAVTEGASFPVRVTLTNAGIATPGQLVITLPQDVVVINGGAAVAQTDGTWIWVFDLAEQAVLSQRLWLQLIGNPPSIEIDALIQSGVAPDLTDHDTLSLSLPVSVGDGLAEALAEVAALASVDKAYRKIETDLHSAQAALADQAVDAAIALLIDVSDQLIKIGTTEAMALRLKVDEALRLAGRQR